MTKYYESGQNADKGEGVWTSFKYGPLLHEEPGAAVGRGGDEAVGNEVDRFLRASLVETDDEVGGREPLLRVLLPRFRGGSHPSSARHISFKEGKSKSHYLAVY